MKPFDLEKAKAGAPVVTRDGRQFTFGAYNPDAKLDQQLVGWSEGVIQAYYPDGRILPGHDFDDDLFMAPVKRRRAVFTNCDGIVVDYDQDGGPPPANWHRATIEWEE